MRSVVSDEKDEKKHFPSETSVSAYPFFSIPPEMDFKDFKSNGKLYSDEIIRFLQENFKIEGHYNKHEIAAALKKAKWSEDIIQEIDQKGYGIFVEEGEIYIKYYGQTRNAREKRYPKKYIAGHGVSSVVKYEQNARTKEIQTIKIIRPGREELDDFCLLYLRKIAYSRKSYFSQKYKVNRIHIRMKYLPHTSVYDFLRNYTDLHLLFFLKLIVGMTKECVSLMRQGILHKDIHMSNFRFNLVTGEVTIIDFGSSYKHHSPIDKTTSIVMESVKNMYHAPEINTYYNLKEVGEENANRNTEASEVYSLGVILLELFTVSFFTQTNTTPHFGFMASIEELDNCVNSNLKSLFPEVYAMTKRMLSFDPKERPSFAECYQLFVEVENNYLKKYPVEQKNIEVTDLLKWKCTDLSTLENKSIKLINSSGATLSVEEQAELEATLIAKHAILFPVVPSTVETFPSLPIFSLPLPIPSLKEVWKKFIDQYEISRSENEFSDLYPKIINEFAMPFNRKKMLGILKPIKDKIDSFHIEPDKIFLIEMIKKIKTWLPQDQFLGVYFLALLHPSTTERNLLEKMDEIFRLFSPSPEKLKIINWIKINVPHYEITPDFYLMLPQKIENLNELTRNFIAFYRENQLNCEAINFLVHLYFRESNDRILRPLNYVKAFLQAEPPAVSSSVSSTEPSPKNLPTRRI